MVEGEGVSSSRQKLGAADKQMPSFHDVPQGDMYIEYSVVMPTAITSETRESEYFVFLPFLYPSPRSEFFRSPHSVPRNGIRRGS